MSILNSCASGSQGVLLKNHPLDPRETFYYKKKEKMESKLKVSLNI
jgi:hypothetical protein